MEIELSSEAGLSSQLFKSCVNLFWLLLQKAIADEALAEEQKSILQDCFAKFMFWGQGFRSVEGGLDDILHFSASLRHQTMLLLKEVAKSLCSPETGEVTGGVLLQLGRY